MSQKQYLPGGQGGQGHRTRGGRQRRGERRRQKTDTEINRDGETEAGGAEPGETEAGGAEMER